jgi:glycine cleavage system regulatory protein
MRSLVLTLIGPDRPGLVEAIAGLVAEHGGNWAESRMASLAGEFAGILRIEVAEEQAGRLGEALAGLEAQGLQVVVKGAEATAPGEGELLSLELVGQDRPGIVREISQALAERGINVEELDTECSSAPMSGETLFRARALLRLPRATSHENLRHSLEAIAEDLMVDIELDGAS